MKSQSPSPVRRDRSWIPMLGSLALVAALIALVVLANVGGEAGSDERPVGTPGSATPVAQ